MLTSGTGGGGGQPPPIPYILGEGVNYLTLTLILAGGGQLPGLDPNPRGWDQLPNPKSAILY